jgi:hypothetical protein
LFYVIAASAGILVWIVVSSTSGLAGSVGLDRVFQVGMPALCMMSALMGLFFAGPRMAMGMVPLAAQLLWMLVTQGPDNLLPLGLSALAISSPSRLFWPLNSAHSCTALIRRVKQTWTLAWSILRWASHRSSRPNLL